MYKKGYLEEYISKFKNMSLADYTQYSKIRGRRILIQSKKDFFKENLQAGKNPNSTDVHATKSIDNIAAYLATYMSKKRR